MHHTIILCRYSRDKHSKPGRDVFSKLTDHHETNPTPRKPTPTRTSFTPSKQPNREWVQNQRNLYTNWINAQFLPDKKYQVSLPPAVVKLGIYTLHYLQDEVDVVMMLCSVTNDTLTPIA